jgi:hypothetical protein
MTSHPLSLRQVIEARDQGHVERKDGAEEDIPCALPAEDPLVEADEHSLFGMVELLLKDPRRLDRLGRDEARQPEMIPRYLAVALSSFTIFGIVMVLLLNAAPAAAYPKSFLLTAPPASWSNLTMFSLPLAYTLGLVAATGICLPSFYFYSLLAGVKMSMLQITGQVLKGKAVTALLLVGILPIYVAVVLGTIIFKLPAETLEVYLYLGLVLPFLAGLAGMRSIYVGVTGWADTLPPERRYRRACFLRRLTLSWSAVFVAVSPIMIYRLWEYFARILGG